MECEVVGSYPPPSLLLTLALPLALPLSMPLRLTHNAAQALTKCPEKSADIRCRCALAFGLGLGLGGGITSYDFALRFLL